MEVAIAYDTLSRWGGQELVTYAMAKALSESGFTVDLVLLFDGEVDRRLVDIPARRIVSLFEHACGSRGSGGWGSTRGS